MVLRTLVKHYHISQTSAEKNLNSDFVPVSSRLPHIITSNLEHDSVKLVLESMQTEREAEVSFVPASKLTGRVEVNDVMAAIQPSTCLVTIMMANNETGIIQPIEEIGESLKLINQKRKGPHIFFHTDAAQALGKVPVDVQALQVDYLTVVGHKFYGPRIGALFVRDVSSVTPLFPMLYGGGQERNFRPGTENTGMIAGLGKAAQLVVENLDEYEKHMKMIRDYLEDRIKNTFLENGVTFNGRRSGVDRLPNTSSVSIHGKELYGHRILSRVRHLQASVGAACHAQNRPSRILIASGVSEELAANALRLSVGRNTSKEDIDLAVDDLKQAVIHIQSEAHSS